MAGIGVDEAGAQTNTSVDKAVAEESGATAPQV